ncbi:tripartite motif-containing protein 2-like [Anneissia japonica]|uniref:tripartite motif-containing protein 2-like n=1 Tax=Anneissia japonica TaxID=1529436 RepID=UPI0014254C55|nr:tripartite motif-containing protein 2-like [Anneissia japonica]
MSADKALHTLEGSKDGQITCPTHCSMVLEFYCSTCKKSACKQCEHVFNCFKNHEVTEMKVAVDKFNQNAIKLIQTTEEIKNKLQETFDSIIKDRLNFDTHLKLCRKAIEDQKETIIKKIRERTEALMADLIEGHKAKIEDHDTKIKFLESKRTQVHSLKTAIHAIMNKPEETENLEHHKTTINTIRDQVLGTDFDKSVQIMNITPNFIPSKHLDKLINTEGIGRITNVDSMMYKVDKDDEAITVIKGDPFVVEVSSLAGSNACKLAATLKNLISGKELPTGVEYGTNGKYKITGRCNVEGDWQMKITVGGTHIKGSPVTIKAERLGLVHTIDNKEHTNTNTVIDVVLDTDGCMLLLSGSEYILKFNQSGLFIEKIEWPKYAKINRMHLMSNGHMVYSDGYRKCVVMCDAKFKKIRSFGKKQLKYPEGSTVNEETRVLYVVDRESHCVCKFNVDNGKLLGKIGSEGSKVGQMNRPEGVTLTKEGHVIVADCQNCRIQMFDVNDKFMRTLVGSGEEDGKVWYPFGVTMDMDENIIISSINKLQLFNKNGVFIKRIDHQDDGLNGPLGITVIANKTRRVAVANNRQNNVKVFNY